MNTVRKIFAVAAIFAMVMGSSTQAFADENQKKLIQALKTEVAQLPGVTVGYDDKSGILTIFGFSDDRFKIQELIKRMEALDNVKEVRNNVTIESN